MLYKIKKIIKYIAYAIITNVIYGLIVYNVVTWLIGYSLTYGYLGNLVFIILGLGLDEITHRMYQSKKFVMQVKKEKDREINYRIIRWQMENFVSFKSILYLFYIFILIVSQIIEFSPTLVGEDIGNFIHTTNYSILLLVAFDELKGQFLKDRRRMDKISKQFMEYWNESRD